MGDSTKYLELYMNMKWGAPGVFSPDPNGARGPSTKTNFPASRPAGRHGGPAPHIICYIIYYIYICTYICICVYEILYLSYWMAYWMAPQPTSNRILVDFGFF